MQKTNAFATEDYRVIGKMPIPPLLQADQAFSQLMNAGDVIGASDRAENLGFYALAHALRRESKGDIGLLVNEKSWTRPKFGKPSGTDYDNMSLGELISLRTQLERDVAELRWADEPGTGLTYETAKSNLKSRRLELAKVETAFEYVKKKQNKSMGKFFSKNFKLPKVKCGFLTKRSMGLKPSQSCGCSACNHSH